MATTVCSSKLATPNRCPPPPSHCSAISIASKPCPRLAARPRRIISAPLASFRCTRTTTTASSPALSQRTSTLLLSILSSSISRRMLHTIDHQDIHRSLPRLQLEPQLFLQTLPKVWPRRIRRSIELRNPVQRKVGRPAQSCFIDYWPRQRRHAGHRRQRARQQTQRHTAPSETDMTRCTGGKMCNHPTNFR